MYVVADCALQILLQTGQHGLFSYHLNLKKDICSPIKRLTSILTSWLTSVQYVEIQVLILTAL